MRWLIALPLLLGFGQPLWAQDAASGTASLDWLNQVISQQGLWIGLIAVFFGGLALNLTPCVYPMIPVTLAFFGGQSGSTLRRGVLLPCAYVLGIALNYAVLGLVAAKTGALFGSWLQQPVALLGIAAMVVALALSMFGLYELRVPSAITRRMGQASAGLWGAFLMGLLVGVVAAPCIGPFVLSLLLFVSRLADPIAGFLLFFVLGLGMGAPYIILGLAAQRVSRLPKAGAWLVWSKRLLGVVLLGLAFYFVRSLLPRSAPAPGVAWIPYTEAALEAARRDQRPVLVDVYADWCIPCVEMDHTTFRHPDVVHALAGVATLRVDATHEISPDAERLLERHQVYGAPTVLLFDRRGAERRELRLTGFIRPKEFLERLRPILSP
ncbi:MAG: thioredoxin family protein [Candidatus Omnitrophica bacterium]|nr:thioredoxin family protein [Candidatus Omnitrophota bacterium]